jgi:hypothetical protein
VLIRWGFVGSASSVTGMSTNTGSQAVPGEQVRPTRTYAWAAALIVGIALVLGAQFVLDSLADSNDTWHWVQHATLFWGGVMTGAGALRLYQVGGRPA